MRSAQRTTKAEPVPELKNGDHLSVAEFERRYKAMPHLKKAELIGGQVYMPSPVAADDHGTPHCDFMTWLGLYAAMTPGTKGADNSTVKLAAGDNEPQPDGLLRILPECGGQTTTDDDGYIIGAPELVGEISSSSVSYDLHEKFDAYQRNRAREYIVWRVEDQAIDWFQLRGRFFRPMKPGADGLYRSKVFPGLWLDARALIDDDMPRVVQVLQEGLGSPEHQRFVTRLQAKK
jgi:Uma2 family endonuclease